MRYVWEEDIDIFTVNTSDLRVQWHLKRVIPDSQGIRLNGYKATVAWISREGDRKYRLRHLGDMNHMTNWNKNDKTFRSLKAAKAYAVAIITLE